MNEQKSFLKIGFVSGWFLTVTIPAIAGIAIVETAIAQTGNGSDMTGPNPESMMPQSDITGPNVTEVPETEEEEGNKEGEEKENEEGEEENEEGEEENEEGEEENEEEEKEGEEDSGEAEGDTGEVDRSAYEGELQQAEVDVAVQLIEEYQAIEFSSYLGLELFGEVPSLTEISETLYRIWQTSGEKAAFIYVSSQSDRLELLAVFPQKTGADIIRRSLPEAPRELLIETAGQLQAEISNPRKLRYKSYLEPAGKLHQWLVAPVEEQLQEKEIETLVFSMDSGLRALPLAALHDGREFLIEKHAIALVPSFGLADITYFDIRRSPILAMGASKFSGLPPLPAVPLELQTIINRPRQGQLFLNENFTLANFASQNRQEKPGIIHLATHAEFRPGDPSNSYIQFFQQKVRLDIIQQLARELGWNSANANPVELLVLSACRTAFGDPEAELGFAGVAVLSGVKSVLASLWYVSDTGTLALMSEFYQQLSENPIKAQALRRSQLALLRGEAKVQKGVLILADGSELPLPEELSATGNLNFSHPYYWSAFVTIGNWN